MSRTLYIHICSHKTGTTSAQVALNTCDAQLAAHGLHYFTDPRTEDLERTAHAHSWVRHYGYPEQSAVMLEPDALARRLGAFGESVVLSSENLSFVYEAEAIAEIRDHLAPLFDEIRIIAYIRRQDLHAVSHKQEGSKIFRATEYNLWGNGLDPLPDYSPTLRRYLDYNARLGLWGDVFGDDKMMIRIYERALLEKGDTTADIFKLLGLGTPDVKPEENVSKSAVKTMLGHMLNARKYRHTRRLHRILDTLEIAEVARVPSQAEAEAFYGHFADANAALNARFGLRPEIPDIFEKDFETRYGETAFQWRDEDVAALLQLVFGELDKRVKPMPRRDAQGPKAPTTPVATPVATQEHTET